MFKRERFPLKFILLCAPRVLERGGMSYRDLIEAMQNLAIIDLCQGRYSVCSSIPGSRQNAQVDRRYAR